MRNFVVYTLVGCSLVRPLAHAQEEEPGWLDSLHQSFSGSVQDTAVWFDDFFDDDLTKDSQAKARARVRLGWEPAAGNLDAMTARFRIKVKLPALKDKVDLIFTDIPNEEVDNQPFEGESAELDSADELKAAVRVIHQDDSTRFFDTRLGIGSGTVFVRSRSRRDWVWEDTYLFRIEPSISYLADDGWLGEVRGKFEVQTTPTRQWQFTQRWRIGQDFDGWRWQQGIYQVNQISEDIALIHGIVINGEVDEDKRTNRIRLGSRWRQRTSRHWMFFEIEPFFEWDRENDFDPTPGIALRVEGNFGNY